MVPGEFACVAWGLERWCRRLASWGSATSWAGLVRLPEEERFRVRLRAIG
jgi:hypothetical protein